MPAWNRQTALAEFRRKPRATRRRLVERQRFGPGGRTGPGLPGGAIAQAQRRTDIGLGAVGRTGAGREAYLAQQRTARPGGMAAAGARAGARERTLAGVPRPFAVREPTQVGYQAATLGYQPGQALRSGVGYRGQQVGGPGAGMGVSRYETDEPGMRAGLAPGGVAVRLSGTYPTQAEQPDLGGLRSAYLRGGTRAVDAYRTAIEAGQDPAAAMDAATMVQQQQAAGGGPLTRGDILRGQAETAAATEQARAVEQIARDMPEAMKQQQKNDFITRMAELGQAYLDGGDIDSWRRITGVTEKLMTGQEPPPGWWDWLTQTMGIGVVLLYRKLFKRGTPSGGSAGEGQ